MKPLAITMVSVFFFYRFSILHNTVKSTARCTKGQLVLNLSVVGFVACAGATLNAHVFQIIDCSNQSEK